MTWLYQFTPFVWLALLSAVSMAGLGGYCLRHRSAPGARALAAAMFVSVLLVLGIAMQALALDAPARIFWGRFQEFWLMPVAVTSLWFSIEYANLGRRWKPRILAWLLAPAFLKIVLELTNNLHHWMWLEGQTGGADPSSRGPLMWALVVYGYLLVALHVAVLGWLFVKSPRHRWPAALLLFSRVSTAVLFGFGMAGLDSAPPSHLHLAMILVAFGVHFIAFFGFGILNPVSMARGLAIEQMREGMIVLDADRRVVDMNPSAAKIFHLSLARARGRSLEQVLPQLAGSGPEIVLGEGATARYFALEHSPLADPRGFTAGSLLLLHEVTGQRQAQMQLMEQGRAIAALEERQRLARDLHDSLGQVLGFISLQAGSVRKLYRDGHVASGEAQLARLAEIAQDAHADVREFILNLRMGPAPDLPFFATLEQYMRQFSTQTGLLTGLYVAEELRDLEFDPDMRMQIYRIIQESLSNARRHAAARKVEVLFEAAGDTARVEIRDDGCGFDAAQVEGQGRFGLDFMRERAEGLGGDLQLQSSPGQGTRVIVDIPIKVGAPV